MSDKDDTTVDDIVDMLNWASGVLEENREVVNKAVSLAGMGGGGPDKLSIADIEPLAEVRNEEDKVVIVAEIKVDGLSEVGVNKKDGKLRIATGNRVIEAVDIPDNLDIDNADATMNNGVLTVDIPRTGGMDSEVNDNEGEM